MTEPAAENGFVPDITVLFCQHCASHDMDPVDSIRKGDGFTAHSVVMPCSSKVEIRQILKLFELGADGIQIVGCPDGACRFLVGSNRAERRVNYVAGILEEINFGPERVNIIRQSGLNGEKLLELAAEMAEKVRPLGPNPMKKTES